MPKLATVLLYRVGQAPQKVEVSRDFSEVSKLIGADLIQITNLWQRKEGRMVPLPLHVACDEEGRIMGKPFNRMLGGHQLHGDFIICRGYSINSLRPGDVSKVFALEE